MSIANIFERQMLNLINDERSALGITPLSLELRLNDSSEDHSSWMLQTDTFSHTGQGGSSSGDRMRAADFTFSGSWSSGENIAWQSERGASGIADDVFNLHESLMNSPGHRANILNPNFELIGIGIERGDYKGWDSVMVTQNFARTNAPVSLDRDQGQGGSSGGTTQTPQVPQTPPSTGPAVHVDDLVLSNVRGSNTAWLDDHLQLEGIAAEDVQWYKILDRDGRDSFIFKGEGWIDADRPVRIDPDDLDMIRFAADRQVGSEMTLHVRAYDGKNLSDWESFTVSTVAPEDLFA